MDKFKFCFVFLDSSNRMPYIYKYIQAESYKYDLVLWDRSNLEDDCGAEVCYRLKHPLLKKKEYLARLKNYKDI